MSDLPPCQLPKVSLGSVGSNRNDGLFRAFEPSYEASGNFWLN